MERAKGIEPSYAAWETSASTAGACKQLSKHKKLATRIPLFLEVP